MEPVNEYRKTKGRQAMGSDESLLVYIKRTAIAKT